MNWGITDRRHFLKHLGASAAFLGASDAFIGSLHAQQAALKKNQKALIILRMGGGATTIDLWDMKPGHANGGAHKPKPTAASGVMISEHLPELAKQFKNLSIVRSLSTTEGDHMRGTVLTTTGQSPSPLSPFPPVGSVMAYQFREQEPDLPAFISVSTGTRDGGFLGMRYAPFTIGNPGQPPENIRPPAGVVGTRVETRADLISKLDSSFKPGVEKDGAKAHRETYEKALSLIVSKNKDVFSLEKEKPETRDLYGRSQLGSGLLLARKLVEAGSVCVEVGMGGWDNHGQIFPTLERRLPEMDKAIDGLV